MSLSSSFVRVRKTRHQLKGRNMGEHVEDVPFSLFNSVDEENLQQGEVQMEKHVQNVASH